MDGYEFSFGIARSLAEVALVTALTQVWGRDSVLTSLLFMERRKNGRGPRKRERKHGCISRDQGSMSYCSRFC